MLPASAGRPGEGVKEIPAGLFDDAMGCDADVGGRAGIGGGASISVSVSSMSFSAPRNKLSKILGGAEHKAKGSSDIDRVQLWLRGQTS